MERDSKISHLKTLQSIVNGHAEGRTLAEANGSAAKTAAETKNGIND